MQTLVSRACISSPLEGTDLTQNRSTDYEQMKMDQGLQNVSRWFIFISDPADGFTGFSHVVSQAFHIMSLGKKP